MTKIVLKVRERFNIKKLSISMGLLLILVLSVLVGCSEVKESAQKGYEEGKQQAEQNFGKTSNQTEKEGSDKAFEYSYKINTSLTDFVNLVSEVKKKEVALSGVYTKQRYDQTTAQVKDLINKYRTEVKNVPVKERNANQIYLAYLTDVEKAMTSFEKAIDENNRDIVISETVPDLNSAGEKVNSWAKEMGIPTSK